MRFQQGFINVFFFFWTREIISLDQKEKEKDVNEPLISGYLPSLSLGQDPDFFTVVFGFLQVVLLAEKSFQFQVYF